MSTNNAINRPGPLPMFSVYLGTSILNATGSGTNINPLIFDTKIFDTTSSYSTTTGYFTAPMAGKYAFGSSIFFRNINPTITGSVVGINSTTTGGYYATVNPAANQVSGDFSISGTVFYQLAQGDTVHVFAAMQGGSDTVTIFGGDLGDPRTWFYGYMIE